MSATECVTAMKFKIKTGPFRIGAAHNTMISSSATSNVKPSSVGSKKRGLSEARDGRKEKRRKMDRSVTQQCAIILKKTMTHPAGIQNPTISVRSEPKKLISAVEKQNLGKKLPELLRRKVPSHLQGSLKKSGLDLQMIEKVVNALSDEDLWELKKIVRSSWVVRTAKVAPPKELDRVCQQSRVKITQKDTSSDGSRDHLDVAMKDRGTKLHPDPQLSKPKIESKGVESALHENRMSSCHPVSTTDTAAISAEGLNPSGDSELSTQKALRAALLKSRFADTILKAKQKVDKADPVKSQLEKKRLERQQQEEMVGIETERKLNGSCNVRAEAERKLQRERMRAEAERKLQRRRMRAEAERKLQREQMRAEAERKLLHERERKAARLALEQMVKTVEINNDHRILKDLELLSGCSQSDQYSYSSCESNAEVGSEKSGHFSRALEQLGLFMKDDYNDYMEDEDEDRAVLTELEEGEII